MGLRHFVFMVLLNLNCLRDFAFGSQLFNWLSGVLIMKVISFINDNFPRSFVYANKLRVGWYCFHYSGIIKFESFKGVRLLSL